MIILGAICAVAGIALYFAEIVHVYICVALVLIGICCIISGIIYNIDGEGIGIVWLFGVIIYIIYLFIVATSSLFKWIFLIIVIVILLISLLIFLLVKRNVLIVYRLKVDEAKSDVRIAKHKYLTSLKKLQSQEENRKGKNNTYGFTVKGEYEVTANYVAELAENLETAQLILTNIIREYNELISTFPMNILAKIFKFKKEKFVDQDRLEKSIELNNFDDEEL